MMSGGFFMMGVGLIAMLLVVVIPVALVAVLVWAFTRTNNPSVQLPVTPAPASPGGRFCSHCGAALQSDWSHCPQCGATIQPGVDQ